RCLGARKDGGLQGAAARPVRRCAAADGDRQGLLAPTSRRGEQESIMRIWLLILLSVLSQAALAQITIDKPWTRATAPVAKGGGYMAIQNKGAASDRLVSASSPVAERVELHVHVHEGGVMKMREVPGGYEVPARGTFELKPGGAHLMFMDIKRPFKEGEKIPV